MGPSSFPPHLLSLLSSPQSGTDSATDALEEWILHRRSKGDTLFDVSVGLAELEDRTPPHLTSAFDRARYVTNVPQPSDLTPPMGPFPLARSASSATVLHHLLSQPPPSIEHSREVILEFVLAREMKLRDKKPGKGGKGTLGRDGFEDIGKRLGEVEAGLRGETPNGMSLKQSTSTMTSHSRDPYPTPSSESTPFLNENQQIGLTLVLSLRMSLSYFTLQELANQLLLLALADAERTLVQHIRRRIPGEGRWGVGKELEYVESLTLARRPALRPAFRSAKARTQLPFKPLYPIQLPAPSKSSCIKLIQTLSKEIDAGGPISIAGHPISQHSSGFPSPTATAYSPTADKSHFMSKKAAASPTTNSTFLSGSPQTPLSSLPPPLHSPSTGTTRNLHQDPNILANYAMELISEFITREKREHILKSKWAKSGREQLGKEVGEIESALCMASKKDASPIAPTLLPIFLLLRRNFALPRSPLPLAIIEPYLDILPAPPDPDDVPFREPTVQTVTASLYVNPRLDDPAAAIVLEELVEFEKETAQSAGGTQDGVTAWLLNLIDSVQKRFPDGSYEGVFATVKEQIARPPQLSPPVHHNVQFAKQPSIHRRTKSSAVFPGADLGSPTLLATPQNVATRQQHSRSFSMPTRQSTYEESESSSSDSDEPPSHSQIQQPAILTSAKQLPPLQMLSPLEMDEKRSSAGEGSGGWWDIVSAMDQDNPAPWQESRPIQRSSSSAASLDLPLPPGAEPAQILDFSTPMLSDMNKLELSPPTPPRQMPFSRSPATASPGQRSKTMNTPSPHERVYSPSQKNGPISAGPIGQSGSYFPEERLPPPPLRFDVPSSSPNRSVSGTSTPAPQGSPNNPVMPLSAPALAPTRSKLGVIGRSMSLMHKKDKEKDNEKDKDKENERSNGGKKSKVQNDPGKWDRSMVASIMGAPNDKR
ncbi:uncharacterized protein L201_007358 [Kwoniella dendrophila CBS 6074]|uniref:Rho-GAP domain-containing protein n=1 Tax=Kwoniella dendrophila CBS 6074 TaxID=1295534 RepID=A0AAX4K3U3_9TREE